MTRYQKTKAQKHTEHGGNSHQRLRIVYFGIALVMLVVIGRLVVVQSFHHERFKDKAFRQHIRERLLMPDRGEIFLMRGSDRHPAAVSREYFLAFVSPKEVDEEDVDHVAPRIAHILSIDEAAVREKFTKREDIYEELKHKITRQDMEHMREEKIPGLHFAPEKQRFYPGHALAAHVLGFVGENEKGVSGRYGAEAYFEEDLRGEEGFAKEEQDARGGPLGVADHDRKPSKNGTSFVLSLEHAIQQETEKILLEDQEKYDAEQGTVIVMEVKTGKILAMANVPTFSPNTYSEVEDISVYKNGAVSDTYESGSVFKTFTIAMGLDMEKITPESTYVDEGFVDIAEYTMKNAEDKVYGLQTMTQVLEESINTGVIHVERLVGNITFKEYVEQFGFGEKTGIALPAEARGNIRNLNNVRQTIEYYSASFGQGITVTPIQLVTAYGALANKGIMMEPQILNKKILNDGTEEIVEPREVRRVISEKASDQITKMLHQVVVGGHAKLADVEGYAVCGKTGTAQVVDTTTKGYHDETRKNTTFIGYAPLEDPQYVVLVKYNNPRNAEWAATSAAPTFGRIMKFVLDYYNVPQIIQGNES